MRIEAIGSPNEEGLPISDGIKAGDFIFVSGMVAFGSDGEIVPGGVAAETDKIMHDLAVVLGKAGSALSDVVKVTVYLTDAADFDAFNSTYAKYFNDPLPARIGVVAALTINAKVEMDFIAYVGP